jgi:hypothetical protein
MLTTGNALVFATGGAHANKAVPASMLHEEYTRTILPSIAGSTSSAASTSPTGTSAKRLAECVIA